MKKQLLKQHKAQRYIFISFTALVVLIFLLFIRDFLSVIALSFLTVILFNPLYKKYLKKFNNKQGLAVSMTITSIFLSLIVPFLIIIGLSVYQARSFYEDFREYVVVDENPESTSTSQLFDDSIERVNEVLDSVDFIEYQVSKEGLSDSLSDIAQPLGEVAISGAARVGLSTLNLMTQLIVYLTLIASIFPNQARIKRYLMSITPIENEILETYIKRMIAMAKSMIKGTFVIGLVQGLVSVIFLWITGVPYLFFFLMLLIVLSIIPVVGSGLIIVPIGIIQILTGQIWQGVFLILTNFLVTSNIDNVLRPRLVSNEARLPAALTLIGVFAGISLFGFLGIIYGPVVVIFVVTTIEMYKRYYNLKE
jgi:predicted PurR-regulated permease PerM